MWPWQREAKRDSGGDGLPQNVLIDLFGKYAFAKRPKNVLAGQRAQVRPLSSVLDATRPLHALLFQRMVSLKALKGLLAFQLTYCTAGQLGNSPGICGSVGSGKC